MSPSESELRSFLRDGEGEPIDPDVLIAHARGVRHNRRVRLASVAAAVVAVGAIGAGTLALSGGNGGGPSAGANGAAGTNSTGGGTLTQTRAPASPLATSPLVNGPVATGTITCPSIPLRLMLPGGGGTGQLGGDGPLFDGPVASMQICGYAAAGITGQLAYSGTSMITGSIANETATSLDAASTNRIIRPCPIRQTRALIIYATSVTGTSQKPVVVDYSSCFPSATNGTAARYDWTPPTDIAGTLNALMTPKPSIPNQSDGRSFAPSGSPVR
ncbi:MAG: hypothetical protein ABI301_07360 [Jatrophihabitantaceae bacterium]